MLTCIEVVQIAILPNGNSYFDWWASVHALDRAHHSDHVGFVRRVASALVTLEAERR